MVLVAAEVAVLVSETALHPRIGGPTVMRAQLEHLARLATRAKAGVGIVPLDQHPVLVEHRWAQRDQVMIIEAAAGDLGTAADPTEVAQHERWANGLASVALSGSAAACRCLEVTRDLRAG